MFDLLGFKVMLGKSTLNLFDGDRARVVEKRPPPPPPPPCAPSILGDPEEELEVYLRKSLSNSSSSKEGNAERPPIVVDAALGVVGVDLEEEDPEEVVEGVRRCRRGERPRRGEEQPEEEEKDDVVDVVDAGEEIGTLS